jgi:hypothetical protein
MSIYEHNKGVCWASAAVAVVPLAAGIVWLGLILLACWACFMLRAR